MFLYRFQINWDQLNQVKLFKNFSLPHIQASSELPLQPPLLSNAVTTESSDPADCWLECKVEAKTSSILEGSATEKGKIVKSGYYWWNGLLWINAISISMQLIKINLKLPYYCHDQLLQSTPLESQQSHERNSYFSIKPLNWRGLLCRLASDQHVPYSATV